ncbi:MAG: hypothetical protein Q4F28_00735 [Eubacteriales bacterium]|nr:hypothetical protein [Eubacteriales bacterium]
MSKEIRKPEEFERKARIPSPYTDNENERTWLPKIGTDDKRMKDLEKIRTY